MFEAEENKIEEITLKAFEEAEKGNFSKAERIINKLRNSWCVTESTRGVVLIEAYILLQKKKKKRAKEKILNNNYATWGSPDLLHLLRLCHPPIDSTTKLFQMTLKGGYATFGLFTQFSSEHLCDLEIIANSKTEAFEYAKELCRFMEPESVNILLVKETGCPGEEMNRGVLKTTPFRVIEENVH